MLSWEAEHVRLSGQLEGGELSRVAALFDDAPNSGFRETWMRAIESGCGADFSKR